MAEREAMQVTVEDVSSVKKTLHIEIPLEQVVGELDSAYRTLKKTAKIKGFRPGKVPRSVLERMFKKDVHADVSSKLIQQSFVDAVKQTDLKIIGNPQVDPPELHTEGPYKYEATVEIKPHIDDIEFKGLELKQSVYRIDEAEVDLQLKALQKNLAQRLPIKEDRPAREGDYVVLTYEGLKNGKPYSETQRTENFTTKIGEGKIVKDFDDGLIGMRPGEHKEIKVKFPEDYDNENLAGLDVDFQVDLAEIREDVLPAIDDDLAKRAGNYQTLDELKQRIRENLQQGYDKRSEQELNEQVFQALISQSDFEVPDVMVDYELESIVDEAERSFSYRNTSLEDMGLTREGIAEKYRDTAVKQVKRHLILEKIVEQEGLELADEELEQGLQELADAFQQPLEQIKAYYSQNPDRIEILKSSLLEKKAIKLIFEHSQIEEVPATDNGDTSKKK
jgi:trigger factor